MSIEGCDVWSLALQVEEKARRKQQEAALQRKMDADMEAARVAALRLREVRAATLRTGRSVKVCMVPHG